MNRILKISTKDIQLLFEIDGGKMWELFKAFDLSLERKRNSYH